MCVRAASQDLACVFYPNLNLLYGMQYGSKDTGTRMDAYEFVDTQGTKNYESRGDTVV